VSQTARGESAGIPRTSLPTGRSTAGPDYAVLPYLRLVRAPAVFSALGDPLAGLILSTGRLPAGRAVGVSAAAGALYLAGMALNDYADQEEDARDRAGRPIPSGAVSATEAVVIGSALMTVGVLLARGSRAPRTGAALAASVLAYDFVLKSTPAGPAAMGVCRALSLLMGAEAGGRGAAWIIAAPAAAVLGTYIGGLTLLAHGETAGGSTRTPVRGIAVAAGALVAVWAVGGRRALPWVLAAAALAGPHVGRAARERSPEAVGRAVGSMIRVVPAIDAALAARRSPVRAGAVALPLLALARWGRAMIPIH